MTAELIRARDHARLWAHQYDRQLSGLLTLQDEIAREITDAIQSSLGTRAPAPERRGAGPRRPPMPTISTCGDSTSSTSGRTRTSGAAASFFEQAVQRRFRLRPRLGRAGRRRRPGRRLYRSGRRRSWWRGPAPPPLEALALDPSLAEAHAALALIVQNHDWDWQTAEREFRQAIALNPNYATAHHWYAEHLMWRGRFDEALRESERARQLDPLSLIIAADNGAILYFARQYDRAIDRLRSVHAIDPTLSRAHLLVAVYADDGMFDQALAEEERWRPLVPAPVHWATLAYIYGRAGRTAEARHAIRELVRVSRAGAGPGPRVRVELCRRGRHGADPGLAGEGVRGALGRDGDPEGQPGLRLPPGGSAVSSACWSGSGWDADECRTRGGCALSHLAEQLFGNMQPTARLRGAENQAVAPLPPQAHSGGGWCGAQT